tara:strand:- start:774 stop:899 length:126 start_codon:yes stop_codon:yes gene_type:complete
MPKNKLSKAKLKKINKKKKKRNPLEVKEKMKLLEIRVKAIH